MLTEQDLNHSLPKLDGSVQLDGLTAHVEVYRDAQGVPHVRAASEQDAFFAQGFVAAQDRLWQMEYDRRRAAGRWAEVVGASAVGQDKMMRRFRLESAARADYQAVEGHTRMMLEAYAVGVNAFITTTSSLPVEYGITGLQPSPGSRGMGYWCSRCGTFSWGSSSPSCGAPGWSPKRGPRRQPVCLRGGDRGNC